MKHELICPVSPGYDIKLHPMVRSLSGRLELWGMWSYALSPPLPGPLRLGEVVPARVPWLKLLFLLSCGEASGRSRPLTDTSVASHVEGPDHLSRYPGREYEMTEHITDHDIATGSEPCRLLGSSHATGGEPGFSTSTADEDAGVAPNPTVWSTALDGRREERSGIRFPKTAVFATWNIRGANARKVQVITDE